MKKLIFAIGLLYSIVPVTLADDSAVSNGLAPVVTDLISEEVSYALEHKLPYLEKPFIDVTPQDRNDGITFGEPGRNAAQVPAHFGKNRNEYRAKMHETDF